MNKVWYLLFSSFFSLALPAVNGPNYQSNVTKFNIKNQVSKDQAKYWFSYFTGRGKKSFESHISRGERYKKIVLSILNENELPLALYYVGLIESGYSERVKSRAGAVGHWQFMKKTGLKYGLKINSFIDERINIYKSTHAASLYLKDLHNIFNDWSLALAAYNSGEYRVLSAIREGNTRSYKDLCYKKLLPEETCYYVSKTWVSRELDLRHKEFGISKKLENDYFPILSKFMLKRKKNVLDLATSVGLKKHEFLKFNPDIIHSSIVGTVDNPIDLYLPLQKVIDIQAGLSLSTISRVKDADRLKQLGMAEIKKGDSIHIISTNNKLLHLKNLRTGGKITLKTSDYFY